VLLDGKEIDAYVGFPFQSHRVALSSWLANTAWRPRRCLLGEECQGLASKDNGRWRRRHIGVPLRR
jgi:hypothetical protein